ncbi:MAG: ABC transporter permease subunit [Desulfovibrionaceae bacterium]|nr:ABC transporter permease subunit [Desulfovibrionaceae bacterium]
MKTRNPLIRIFILVVAVWLIIFALVPNLFLLLISFFKPDGHAYVAVDFTLANYQRLLTPSFITIFTDSLRLALASTLICLLIGYPFAYILARAPLRIRPWLLLLIVIPFWTSSLIRTYALINILQNNGILSKLLELLHITSEPVSFMYSEFAVLAGLSYTMLPFMILPIYASVEKLDARLIDAANDLGAGNLRTFWHIILPLTAPGIMSGCILVFLPALTLFYVPDILGGGKGQLLGNYIQMQFTKPIPDWPLGAATSTILTLVLLLMVLGYKWTLKISSQRADFDAEDEEYAGASNIPLQPRGACGLGTRIVPRRRRVSGADAGGDE